MVEVAQDKLPREYERVIIEEYYKFFKNLYGGTPRIFGTVRNYTADAKKMDPRDASNEQFLRAVAAYNSIADDDIEFLLFKDEEGIVNYLARIRKDEASLQIGEIIFLNYPTVEEKRDGIKITLAAVEAYAAYQNLDKVYFEIPVGDALSMRVGSASGYSEYHNSQDKNVYPTHVLEKSVARTRDEYDWTRCRKQGQKSNE